MSTPSPVVLQFVLRLTVFVFFQKASKDTEVLFCWTGFLHVACSVLRCCVIRCFIIGGSFNIANLTNKRICFLSVKEKQFKTGIFSLQLLSHLSSETCSQIRQQQYRCVCICWQIWKLEYFCTYLCICMYLCLSVNVHWLFCTFSPNKAARVDWEVMSDQSPHSSAGPVPQWQLH